MKPLLTLLGTSIFLITTASHAAAPEAKRPPFTGIDISGVYACTGNDAHDGDFANTMTLTLDKHYSAGKSGSFKVTMAGEHDSYTGAIVSNGTQLALDFANKDLSKNDFGVALATVSRASKGKFRIEKFYYQPQYMGGSNGVETCVQQ